MFFMIFIAILSCHGIHYASYPNNSDFYDGSYTPPQEKLTRPTSLNFSPIQDDIYNPLNRPNSLGFSPIERDIIDIGYQSFHDPAIIQTRNSETRIRIQPDDSNNIDLNFPTPDPHRKKLLIGCGCAFFIVIAGTITWVIEKATA